VADTFTYQASDVIRLSNTATVTITVTAVNDPPAAQADLYVTDEDTPLTVAAPGVLGNDSDPEGSNLTAVLVTTPTQGTVTFIADGSFIYYPNVNVHGTDSFTYRASDGAAQSAPATVTLVVTPVNDPPIAADDAYTTAEDTVLTVAAPGVLGNDSDVDGDPLSAVLVAGPANGTLTLGANGSFTYTPNVDFNGPDSFTRLTLEYATSFFMSGCTIATSAP
jgi:VCBS repeat-containing protein